MMDYKELAKSLRICGEWGTEVRIPGEPSECDGCIYYNAENDDCKSWDEPWRKEHLLLDAASAIEKLVQVCDHQREILAQFGGETGIRQAFERMDDYWQLVDKYSELLKAAKKMHTWIFLHTGDEQKAYDECGLSDEMNAALGYGGQFVATLPEEKT